VAAGAWARRKEIPRAPAKDQCSSSTFMSETMVGIAVIRWISLQAKTTLFVGQNLNAKTTLLLGRRSDFGQSIGCVQFKVIGW